MDSLYDPVTIAVHTSLRLHRTACDNWVLSFQCVSGEQRCPISGFNLKSITLSPVFNFPRDKLPLTPGCHAAEWSFNRKFWRKKQLLNWFLQCLMYFWPSTQNASVCFVSHEKWTHSVLHTVGRRAQRGSVENWLKQCYNNCKEFQHGGVGEMEVDRGWRHLCHEQTIDYHSKY